MRASTEQEQIDEKSILSLYKKLIQVRKEYRILQDGEFEFIDSGNSNVMAYMRYSSEGHMIVLLNFSSKPQKVIIPNLDDYSLLFSILDIGDKNSTSNIINPLIIESFNGYILYKKQT